MSFPSGITITNKGRALLAKAQTGIQLNITKIKIGDGTLTGQLPGDMTDLISIKKVLEIKGLSSLIVGEFLINSSFSNEGLVNGFYFREVGIYATDPVVGEILYCYGNAGVAAEYIPADAGAAVLEKYLEYIIIVGSASNVSAVINSSLVYASAQDLSDGLAGKVSHSLATAANDFLVASSASKFIKKTLAEVKIILGLGGAAYKDIGVSGGVAKQDDLTALGQDVTTHKADLSSQASGKGASLIGLNDSANQFTATNVEGALNELFTNANSGKQNWVDVVGTPLVNTDTFATLKSKTQTLKNTMATNLTSKKQSSVGTESLSSLIDKVASIKTMQSIAVTQSGIANINSALTGNSGIILTYIDDEVLCLSGCGGNSCKKAIKIDYNMTILKVATSPYTVSQTGTIIVFAALTKDKVVYKKTIGYQSTENWEVQDNNGNVLATVPLPYGYYNQAVAIGNYVYATSSNSGLTSHQMNGTVVKNYGTLDSGKMMQAIRKDKTILFTAGSTFKIIDALTTNILIDATSTLMDSQFLNVINNN